ncbi:sugar ABC transporter ATP-binding protein [Anaerolentibacter hominis]|uniref:sugar ABC transporter ATP-binding protein n=1 Tax=Anaerolentibacter hominis TaxID=3079009 RepID=UPI0031B8866A
MSEEKYLLEMDGIEKAFPGVKALDHVSLKLRKGTVHALMGENGAGKSTLMKCLFGLYKKDAGTILIEGNETEYSDPKDALVHGVSMVHQELNQVLRRNVMENIWLGRFPLKAGLINHKKMYDDTKALMDQLSMDVDPKQELSTISVSRRQMIEIAKAVSYNVKILVLDEPTSSLSTEETDKLFEIIRMLRDQGVGIIYISHKIDEILKISDEVTIMRDGRNVVTETTENLTTDLIIKNMVGRDFSNRYPPRTNVVSEEVMLEVRNLTGMYPPNCQDVSFELHKGEILGISGLVGSRRTELLETIFGVAHHSSGELIKEGKPIVNHSSQSALKNGFAYLTEERRATGIFPQADITFNTVIANIRSYKKGGLLSSKKMQEDTQQMIEALSTKTPSQKAKIQNLSGGNQQKVIIARWLLISPDILLLDEPTRGIDVGAKYEIYELIIDLAKQGKSVIFVSSEMPELLGVCNRIAVMSNGRLAGIVEGEDMNEEEIMRLSVKYI